MPCWGWIGSLAALPRAGLIHRLDKDTSGLLVVARTPAAQTSLSRQLEARTMAREYVAVCVGVMTGGGTVDEPIGRHRGDRLRMAIRGVGPAGGDALSGAGAIPRAYLLERATGDRPHPSDSPASVAHQVSHRRRSGIRRPLWPAARRAPRR